MSFLNTFQGKEDLLKDVEYIVLDECDKYFEECKLLFNFSLFIANQGLFANVPKLPTSLRSVLSHHPASSLITAQDISPSRLPSN
jgi:hypothetical protein